MALQATIPRPSQFFLSIYWQMEGTGEKASSTASRNEEAEIASGLVARIRNGDRAAESELVARYSRGLLFMLKRRTNGDEQLAEDVHQDAFRIVIERLRTEGINDARKLSGYLHSTGKNVLIGILRRRQRRNTHADSGLIDATPRDESTALDETIHDQMAVKIRELLHQLSSDRDRALLTRFYLQQEDKRTICQALELSDLHFNRVLYRAKNRFRTLVENSDTTTAAELASGRSRG